LQFIAGKEKITLEPAAAHSIARGAEGGLRDAESMLDQLVAFCGEKIAEADVLNVFGFTSEQTVIDLTGKILRGETSAALDVLYEQCEAGKDMMRLMSDLIVYLRDLLVFKAKPDALKEDVDPEVQKALAAQSDLIANDRLLDLIDQFAQAEGRMKWAPNKKLHFEVAIIKAIQTLGQATLDEVIEKLGALRDGKDPKNSAAAKNPVAAVADRGSSKKSAADPPSPGFGVASTAASTAARVAETPPATSAVVDSEKVWREVCAKIPPKGFLRTLVDSLTVLGVEGRNFLLGYPVEEKSAIETLMTANNRRQLEGLINEISGRDSTLKFVAKEGLPRKTSAHPKTVDEFKDDPLIQDALQIFKGEIKT
jgi:DNA polymerase III subunit gamma/tau